MIPDRPTVNTAVGGESYISLIWSLVSGAAFYNIYRATNPDFIPNESNVLVTTLILSYVVAILGNDAADYFYNTSVNDYGKCAVSTQNIGVPKAFIHNFMSYCIQAGCYNGSGTSTANPSTHPLTTDVCEACYNYPN